MLDELRSHAGNFGAKVLLAFLVLSFGIWGVGDMLRHPGSSVTAATVGDQPVSLHAYQRALHDETENIRRVLGERYSPEMVKNLHLQENVMRKLVDDALIKEESESLGLIPSDADIVRRIRADPVFLDSKGNFDKSIFEAALSRAGQSEKTYVEQLRQDLASNILMDTIMANNPVPDEAVQTLYAAREEERSATFYVIGSSLVTGAEPNASQLETYYNAHSHEFSSPEYRTVSYVSFKNDEAQAKVSISEADLQATYKERIDDFKKPERRIVEQLLYSSEDKAKKAADMLAAGTSVDQVAKTTDIFNKSSVSLGAVERSQLPEAAEDAVFALHNGQSTAPIQTPFGWYVYHVSKIEDAAVASFEEAKPALEKDLKQHAADDAVGKLSNKLEDTLAGGSSLSEAAKDLGLKVHNVGPFDSIGQSPDGHAVRDIPDFDKFLEIAFKTDDKTESSLIPTKGGAYYILHVDNITAEHVKKLDEIKPQLVAAWQKAQRGKGVAELADKIAQKFTKKDDRAAIIAKYNLQAVSPAAFKRSAKTAGDVALSEPLVNDLFSHNKGEATGAYAAKNDSYVIAVVNDIIAAPAPDKNSKELAAIRQELGNNMQNEIIAQYLRYLAGKYPVSLNESLLQSSDDVAQR